MRERFPEVRSSSRRTAASRPAGTRACARAGGRYVLLLNSDAWLEPGAARARSSRFADAQPEAAVVGPRLRNPDGSLQRSVRGFPTLWRLATEYLFLRKLGAAARGASTRSTAPASTTTRCARPSS